MSEKVKHVAYMPGGCLIIFSVVLGKIDLKKSFLEEE